MLKRSLSISCIFLAVAISAIGQPSQFEQDGRWINGVSESWFFEAEHPREEILAMQFKWAAIGNELQQPSQHRWQGGYFEGSDTHGDYLRWSPKSGFVWLKVDKCRATVMSFSYGEVVAGPTSVQLITGKTIIGSGNHRHSTFSTVRFLPVIWSKTLWLVPELEMASFGDYVAGVGRYNEWLLYGEFGPMFLSKAFSDNETFPVSKEPIVPHGYERYIKTPIAATVVVVGRAYVQRSDDESWDDLITPVTVKLSRTGAKAKLKFRLLDSDEVIELIKVRGRTASGIIVRPTRKKPCVKFDPEDDCLDPDFDPVTVGLKASTRHITP
jgi:hypothetical protein